jgi:hypothetical protein
MLHGLVTFGLTTLIGFYLLTSGLGMIIGGAGQSGLLGGKRRRPRCCKCRTRIGRCCQTETAGRWRGLGHIQGQVDQLLRQTGKPQLQPENLENRAAGAISQAQNAVQDSGQDIQSIVSRAFSQNGDVANAVDRDALINVIMNRTGKTRPEAEQIVAGFQ